MEMSAMHYLMKEYDAWLKTEHPDAQHDMIIRQWLGRFGVTGSRQTRPMKTLSDGMLSRIAFAWLAKKNPHILLLDEPTNHLDIESIDALAEAINNFDGGMVLVSHDMRLISQVAQEVWNVENGGVNVFRGDIGDYKDKLREIMSLPRSADKNFAEKDDNKKKTKAKAKAKAKANNEAKSESKAKSSGTADAPKVGNSRWQKAPTAMAGAYVPPHLRNR